MAERKQSLEATVLIQGLLIGAMFTVLSRGAPDFKREVLIELKSMVSDHPDNKDGIAAAIRLVENSI